MKYLTQIFQALLGVVALMLTALVAAGRLAWRTIRRWWRKRSKCVRRVTVAILILILAGFAVLTAKGCYELKYGRCFWNDKYISKNIEVHAFRDYKIRVYNHYTDHYVTPKLNWISGTQENDSLAVYALPNKRGYINVRNGEIVIDAKKNNYSKAWVFSEGLAAVMKDGKIGFVNAQNEVVIPFQFEYSIRFNMWNFGYLFHDGYCVMTNKNDKLGLIDRGGKWVVEPSFDEIWTQNNGGYIIVSKDNKYGVLDSLCNMVYPVEYGYVEVVPDGFILTKGGRMWQVDFEGNIVQPFMYGGTYYLNYPVGYDESGEVQYAFADYVKYEIMNRYGIMNRNTGRPITLALYSDINMLSKDLFEVQDPESYDWYLLDTNGNVVSKK